MNPVILLVTNSVTEVNKSAYSHLSFCLSLNCLNGTKQLHKSAFAPSLHSPYMPHTQNVRYPYLQSSIHKNYGRIHRKSNDALLCWPHRKQILLTDLQIIYFLTAKVLTY